MTNRNRKKVHFGIGKREKVNAKEKMEKELYGIGGERRKKRVLTENWDIILHLILPVIAIIISVIALCIQIIYAGREYRYKMDPQVESEGTMSIGVEVGVEGKRVTGDFSSMSIKIKQKNNLQAAYLIHADDRVEKLELNELENELETKIGESNELWEPDIVEGDVSYKYKLLFLKDLDGSYELFLFYIKSDNETVAYHEASEIEIWELENAYPGDKRFIGEKKMAEKYAKILAESEKYIF